MAAPDDHWPGGQRPRVAARTAVWSRRMSDVPAPPSEPSDPSPPAAAGRGPHLRRVPIELRKEAYTMGLYVAICLLGALIALPTDQEDEAQVIAIIGE